MAFSVQDWHATPERASVRFWQSSSCGASVRLSRAPEGLWTTCTTSGMSLHSLATPIAACCACCYVEPPAHLEDVWKARRQPLEQPAHEEQQSTCKMHVPVAGSRSACGMCAYQGWMYPTVEFPILHGWCLCFSAAPLFNLCTHLR